MDKRYLRTPEAATYLRLSEATLNKDRWSRLLGIPFIKAGRAILYDRDDLDSWLGKLKVNTVEVGSRDA
ncbi:MAG: helix-turn-helix domain-containing protein [bacterium]